MSNQTTDFATVPHSPETVSDSVDCANQFSEVWRNIPCTEGAYQVSNLGQVREAGGRILAQYNVGGYRRVKLHASGGGQSTAAVHRLVVEAFIGPIEKGIDVHHRNGDKADNRLDNLELLSRGEHTHRERVLAAAKIEPIGPGGGMSLFDKYDNYGARSQRSVSEATPLRFSQSGGQVSGLPASSSEVA